MEGIARWPQPEFTSHETSSYDRSRIAPDKPGWFANNDHSQFIRVEGWAGRREQVMLDVDGPGALVRSWLTSNDKRTGNLRLWVNGQRVKQDFDGYAPDVTPSGPVDLGAFLAQDGQYILRVEVVGANPKAVGVKALFGLDCIALTQD